jgi:hypothetical protein
MAILIIVMLVQVPVQINLVSVCCQCNLPALRYTYAYSVWRLSLVQLSIRVSALTVCTEAAIVLLTQRGIRLLRLKTRLASPLLF